MATYSQKISNKDNEILWIDCQANYIDRKIRSLFPKYGAYTFFEEKRIKLLKAEVDKKSYLLKPGVIFIDEDKEIHVGCKNKTSLKILNLQIEGKKPMTAWEFIKGNSERFKRIKKFSTSALEN